MKSKKTALALILTAVITVSSCIQKYDSEDDFYVESEGNGVSIIEYTGTKTKVRIPPLIQDMPVIGIEEEAFKECENIISITIPDSVTSIGDGVFNACPKLIEIKVAADNSAYSAQKGVLYNKDKTILIQYPNGKTNISFTIPASVTSMGSLGGNLAEIKVASGSSAYSAQKGVLYNKDKTVLIKYPAAGGKTNTSFNIPTSVKSIEMGAFLNCRNLTRISIPNGVESIGAIAFYLCAGLKSVTIPGSVKSIGMMAFDYCVSLNSVTFSGTIPVSGFEDDIGGQYTAVMFMGDLKYAFYAEDPVNGTPGTYTTGTPGRRDAKWTRQ